MSNELFKNALERKPQNTPPIWFMRQAGRYHSHYQSMKQKNTFVELCKQPELAAEVARGPVAEFDFDVSIMFSDLLFPLEALGIGLVYNPGPQLDKKLDFEVLQQLKSPDEALPALEFQKNVLIATREVLPKNKSLIGFVGGPWTLFTYAVEGSHKATMTQVKTDFQLYNNFCSEYLVPLLKKNIQLQLDGGAEIVMVFDTAAGELSPLMYNQYIVPHLDDLVKTFPGKIGYYSQKTQWSHLKTLCANKDLQGMGFDHRWDLTEAFEKTSHGFVQGNFDQTLLFADGKHFKKALNDYIAPIKDLSPEQRKGWVSGLGHGVLPKTPEQNVHLMIETIRKEFS